MNGFIDVNKTAAEGLDLRDHRGEGPLPLICLSRFERQVLDIAYEVAADGLAPNNHRLFRRAWKVNSYAAYQDVKAARRRLLEAGLLPVPAPGKAVAS